MNKIGLDLCLYRADILVEEIDIKHTKRVHSRIYHCRFCNEKAPVPMDSVTMYFCLFISGPYENRLIENGPIATENSPASLIIYSSHMHGDLQRDRDF